MCRIDRSSDKEVDIRRFFKQQTADLRSAVAFYAPLLVLFVVSEIVFCVFKYLVDRYDSLGDKIHSLYLRDRRHVGLNEIETCDKRLVKELRGDSRGRSSANDMLAFF